MPKKCPPVSSDPYLLSEWDFEKNNKLGVFPDKLSTASEVKVNWLCKARNHSWLVTPKWRQENKKCPKCSCQALSEDYNLLKFFPEICTEWSFKNKKSPQQFFPMSEDAVIWECHCGYEWKTSIAARVFSKTNCPACSGNVAFGSNTLKYKFPKVFAQIHKEKNNGINIELLTPFSHTKCVFQCEVCSYEWITTPKQRNSKEGTKCPSCSKRVPTKDNNLLIKYPELCLEFDYDKNKISPDQIMPQSHQKMWWRCQNKQCSHSWRSRVQGRTIGQSVCPKCSLSRGERKISSILSFYRIGFKQQYRFMEKSIKRYPYDFFIDHNGVTLVIEYQGIQHYQVANFSKNHDKNIDNLRSIQIRDSIKRKYCENNLINFEEISYLHYYHLESYLLDILRKYKILS